MIPSLVDATPRTLSGLRPWEWLRERLEDQDPDGIPKLMEVVVREAANELQPLTLGIEKQIRGADREGELKECEGELAEEALRAALMVGTIKPSPQIPSGARRSPLRALLGDQCHFPNTIPTGRSITVLFSSMAASIRPEALISYWRMPHFLSSRNRSMAGSICCRRARRPCAGPPRL